jgi:hypothetical protein
MNNNVISSQDFAELKAMNEVIRYFVTGRRNINIMYSDIKSYMTSFIIRNGLQMEMNISDPLFFLRYLEPQPIQIQRHHIAHICSENVPHLNADSARSMLSFDGMHFCMETLGLRMFANWACLIKCSYGHRPHL